MSEEEEGFSKEPYSSIITLLPQSKSHYKGTAPYTGIPWCMHWLWIQTLVHSWNSIPHIRSKQSVWRVLQCHRSWKRDTHGPTWARSAWSARTLSTFTSNTTAQVSPALRLEISTQYTKDWIAGAGGIVVGFILATCVRSANCLNTTAAVKPVTYFSLTVKAVNITTIILVI